MARTGRRQARILRQWIPPNFLNIIAIEMENLPLSKIMDFLLDTVCVVDEHGCYVYVSPSMEKLLGYRPDELLGRNMIELVHPDDRERTLNQAGEIMAGQPKAYFQNRYLHRDGRVVDIMWSARWLDEHKLRLAVARDVTELKRAERKQAALYRISEAAHEADGLPALYERIHQIIAELLPLDSFCVVRTDTDEGEPMASYCAGQFDSGHPTAYPGPLSPIRQVIASGEALLTTRDAHSKRYDWLGVPLIAEHKVVGALVLEGSEEAGAYSEDDRDLLQFVSTQVVSAIERKQHEACLQHMAQHDALTDLPNRILFRDRVDMALRLAHREQSCVGVLYLDLNEFKQINDKFGHAAGDQVLKEVADRLSRCIRDSDTVARIGGDEFMVLLATLRAPEDVERVVAKLRDAISAPLRLQDHVFVLSASIGAAVYPEHGETLDELFRRADTEMYAGKRGAVSVA